jgi:hypothetical protein
MLMTAVELVEGNPNPSHSRQETGLTYLLQTKTGTLPGRHGSDFLEDSAGSARNALKLWWAYRWFKASVVKFPDNLTVEVPGYTGPHVTVNALVDTHAALVIASKLKKSAAFWTGVSALLNALAAIAGTLA